MLKLYHTHATLEAGCDEAGRGCLAGPVFAAAVILPADISQKSPELAQGLNDSKQLSEKKRNALRRLIEHHALAWAVSQMDNHQIDRYNILRSSIMSMHHALDQLTHIPLHVIVDGNRFMPWTPPHAKTPVPYTTIVKGDASYMSIAAASILAKTYRDNYMHHIHQEYPMYHWDDNKGYPTQAHRQAIRLYGPTPYHRMTFNLLGESPQLQFDFGR